MNPAYESPLTHRLAAFSKLGWLGCLGFGEFLGFLGFIPGCERVFGLSGLSDAHYLEQMHRQNASRN